MAEITADPNESVCRHRARPEVGRGVTVWLPEGIDKEEEDFMIQQGQVFKLASVARDGGERWAYRYRAGGRDSKRVQRGGFATEADARSALERALEKHRRGRGVGRRLTLEALVDEYLGQHEVSPVTLAKLRFLLDRAVQVFGGYYLDELDPVEDLGLADDRLPRLPLRGHPGAAAGARTRGRLGDDRHQPGQAGG